MTGLLNRIRKDLRSRAVLVAWASLTTMMALAGPFGSYEQVPLHQRLAVWVVITALAIVLTTAIRVVVYSCWKVQDYWRGGTLTALIAALVLTLPLYRLAQVSGDAYLTMPPGLIEIGGFIFCLTMGVNALRHGLETGGVAGFVDSDDEPAPILPRLTLRLPEECRGPVLRISGRDHYVDVTTTCGEASLLMRFSDALAELEGVDGMQVHRSHWVAADAVIGGGREGGRIFLRLTDGGQVPVSRTYMAEVEARGWLAQA
ncbi:LytTR family DNA-binding domain-containing protein [Gemmobacter nectariphilus]|uniref:LytTR family DNA-binding domain-containing protein n=1 Tax=Gemmobacter nectariphilus TaxID=220343 RepID=UPI000A074F2F|nr:LytTR family DNA-binding domain-containing protein [Gemmobacter nectariphilus]